MRSAISGLPRGWGVVYRKDGTAVVKHLDTRELAQQQHLAAMAAAPA